MDEVDFEDSYTPLKPIVSQIEEFAIGNGVELEKGWKVGFAITIKAQLKNKKADVIPKEYIEKWIKLFNALLS